MAYLSIIDSKGTEAIFRYKPIFDKKRNMYVQKNYGVTYIGDSIILPKGTIEKILGIPITFEDGPVRLTKDKI